MEWPNVFAERQRPILIAQNRINSRDHQTLNTEHRMPNIESECWTYASEPTSWSWPRQRRECQQLKSQLGHWLKPKSALSRLRARLDSKLGAQSFPAVSWWSRFKLLAIIFKFVHCACLELIQTLFNFVLALLFLLPSCFFPCVRSQNILHAHRAYD